ncbi:MAG: reverse transcriptase-like protein [Methanosarcinaceae archaeon]|nr:reverse transcriptase-like protein [Methanosarcinaceae archaeon]MDD4498461.1 reverse transcriptase-like protein [Methanosarcinaceae archaeon]
MYFLKLKKKAVIAAIGNTLMLNSGAGFIQLAFASVNSDPAAAYKAIAEAFSRLEGLEKEKTDVLVLSDNESVIEQLKTGAGLESLELARYYREIKELAKPFLKVSYGFAERYHYTPIRDEVIGVWPLNEVLSETCTKKENMQSTFMLKEELSPFETSESLEYYDIKTGQKLANCRIAFDETIARHMVRKGISVYTHPGNREFTGMGPEDPVVYCSYEGENKRYAFPPSRIGVRGECPPETQQSI